MLDNAQFAGGMFVINGVQTSINRIFLVIDVLYKIFTLEDKVNATNLKALQKKIVSIKPLSLIIHKILQYEDNGNKTEKDCTTNLANLFIHIIDYYFYEAVVGRERKKERKKSEF